MFIETSGRATHQHDGTGSHLEYQSNPGCSGQSHISPAFSQRSVLTFTLSVGLDLRANELRSLRWSDVFDTDGSVREVIHLKAAYIKGAKTPSPYAGGIVRDLQGFNVQAALKLHGEVHRP